MNSTQILYPIAMQLLLILITALLTITRRRNGALSGDIKIDQFKAMNLAGLEDKYITPGNSYNNQFQMPMLFMMFVLFTLQLQLVDMFFMVASWIFVGLRYAHAYIHLTYNHVMHRLLCFATSSLILFVCWSRLILLAS